MSFLDLNNGKTDLPSRSLIFGAFGSLAFTIGLSQFGCTEEPEKGNDAIQQAAEECGTTSRRVVKRIIDGDTIVVEGNDNDQDGDLQDDRVRLSGIQADELSGDDAESCFGEEGKIKLEQLLPVGSEVDLIFNPPTAEDDYEGVCTGYFDRLIADIEFRGESIGERMVRSGYARIKNYPGTDPELLERLQEQEDFAMGPPPAGGWGLCDWKPL